VTVTEAIPVFVSLVAVIVADPAATAVTRPVELTEAMLVFALDHVTTRPVSTLLLASRVAAESCAVPPTTRLDVAGDTDTDATGTGAGALTVIAPVPVFVSLNAVIVALPAATAMTTPDAETVLTPVLLELQLITRPVSTLLLASRVTAESCAVPPTRRLDVAGDTDTEATGTGAGALTVIAAEAVCPSLETVMATFPAATAVTRPEAETLAIALFAELHPITRPVSTLLLESSVTADSCTDDPTCRLAVNGDTDTDATGIGAGALTLKREELVLPELVALIIDWPGPIALIFPVLVSTVATVMSELVQVTTRPEIGFPLESASVAVACAVWPIRIAEGLTATATVAIGVGGGGTTAMLA
jgi:hypothetical protein